MRSLKYHKRLYGWGENAPFAWKISWNNGGREAQNGPPFSPQNVMFLFYGLPNYVFHTYLIDFFPSWKLEMEVTTCCPSQSLLIG
jgi:hypothetical protein